MSVVIDPALAAVGKDLILGNDPSSFRRKFDEWYEHHTLLAEAEVIDDLCYTLIVTRTLGHIFVSNFGCKNSHRS